MTRFDKPRSFPPFDLTRLLKTVFEPKGGERTAILIDLDDPAQVKDFAFLNDKDLTIQRYAHDVFHRDLSNGTSAALRLDYKGLFAFEKTGGSNLDLADRVVASDGTELSFEKDIYPNIDLVLCISTYSATAPLTASAKKFGFRGATLHGVNQIILDSGLSVDYNEVSKQAEALRSAMTRADGFDIDFSVAGKTLTLHLECGRQEAQKSHGLCRGTEPDVANLPAGEVYFVPTGAEGQFPMRYEDGTMAVLDVTGGRVVKSTLISGNPATIAEHNAKLASDPVTGELGELGFGTQELPVSGRDIQDEKILGTLHVATGRSDHLGGSLTPDKFANRLNATHDDILFAPWKTPGVVVTQARMRRDGKTVVVYENFEPAPYLLAALEQGGG